MHSSRENLVASALVIGTLIAGISVVGFNTHRLFHRTEIAISTSLSAPDQWQPASANSSAMAAEVASAHGQNQIPQGKHIRTSRTIEASAKGKPDSGVGIITNRSRTNGPLPASYVAKQIHRAIQLRSIVLKRGRNGVNLLIADNGESEPPTLIPSGKRLFDYMRSHDIEFEWYDDPRFISEADLYEKCQQFAKPAQPHELM